MNLMTHSDFPQAIALPLSQTQGRNRKEMEWKDEKTIPHHITLIDLCWLIFIYLDWRLVEFCLLFDSINLLQIINCIYQTIFFTVCSGIHLTISNILFKWNTLDSNSYNQLIF